MILHVSMVLVVTSLLFLTFHLGLFFFMMSLTENWSILFIFSKNHLFVCVCLCVSFISTWVYISSFLLLNLGFVCPSFSVSSRCEVRLLFEFSVYFLSISNISTIPISDPNSWSCSLKFRFFSDFQKVLWCKYNVLINTPSWTWGNILNQTLYLQWNIRIFT